MHHYDTENPKFKLGDSVTCVKPHGPFAIGDRFIVQVGSNGALIISGHFANHPLMKASFDFVKVKPLERLPEWF